MKKTFDRWLAYLDIVYEEQSEEANKALTIEAQEQETQGTSLAQKEADRRIEMCKRVVKRMLLQQVGLAWGAFVDCVMSTKQNREAVRKVLARMTHRQLAGAFDCYSGHVDTEKEQRERVQRTMARWRTPGIQKAFDHWLSYVDISMSEHAEAARELGKQELLEAAQKGQSKAESEVKRRIEMCKHVVYVAPAVVQVLVCTC